MNYNEKIAGEYGMFTQMIGESPLPVKPLPTKKDYETGIFSRVFAKKINDNNIIEISMQQANRLNSDLYIVVVVQWTVSGPRENRMMKGVLEHGVSQMNKFEIERVKKEEGIDLSSVLNNPLEYWQGH